MLLMLPLHLNILLKVRIAELFGKVSVIEKNSIKTIPYKHIHINIKNHYNNLIGKVECHTNTNKFMFYYIPLKTIENYEFKNSGVEIISEISICPFCFGIHLDSEEQYKYYKMIKKKEKEQDTNLDTNLDPNLDPNLDTTIPDDIYKILKEHFCFDFIKKNINNYEVYLSKEENPHYFHQEEG
jgi:hypothetical protein